MSSGNVVSSKAREQYKILFDAGNLLKVAGLMNKAEFLKIRAAKKLIQIEKSLFG